MNAPHPVKPIRLYRHPLSGHSHRAELFLGLLGLPHELVDIDLRTGAQKSADFLKLNRFGQVPVIDDNGTVLADSNAILVYLAQRYGEGRWLPADPLGAAQVQRWLSVAAGPLATGPASARLVNLFGAKLDLPALITRSHALLAVIEAELATRGYLAGEKATIADLACYSYIARAPEGDVSLADYPNIRSWLARIEALPGFVPMIESPVGLAAATT
ncbi:glutathione S-transferase [Jeongeupia wiesaeckerbachi]|uniref:glutathione S-transferase family protein n=1 Tax=Jeongeupia wiesaeckerbachi TaxID=3051218 RepID=UPI003D80921D